MSTSIQVFRDFLRRLPDGSIDASEVTSPECFEAWLRLRPYRTQPEKAFRRSLTGHLTGVDGRIPFTQEEEEAILKVIRRKQKWECFKHETKAGSSGEFGFRAKGFHEKMLEGSAPSTSKKRAKMTLLVSQSAHMAASANGVETAQDNSSINLASNPSGLVSTLPTQVSPSYPLTPSYCSLFSAPSLIPLPTDLPMSSSDSDRKTCVLDRFASASIEAWQTVSSLFRMLVISRGWIYTAAREEQAESLLAAQTSLYPDWHILIVSPNVASFSDRILAQNLLSEKMYGKIAKKYGGFSGTLIFLEDSLQTIRAAGRAMQQPGEPVSYDVRHKCAGVPKVRWMRLFLTLDSDTHLLIQRSRPLEEVVVTEQETQSQSKQE